MRSDGRPHVTPLVAVWQDGALYFCTGPTEQKANNLAHNAQCILTTGCNAFSEGLDLVVEGEAKQVRDEPLLHRLAAQWKTKYDWPFDVRDGAFYGDGGRADVYEVKPAKVLGFGKGDPFSQTRWHFERKPLVATMVFVSFDLDRASHAGVNRAVIGECAALLERLRKRRTRRQHT